MQPRWSIYDNDDKDSCAVQSRDLYSLVQSNGNIFLYQASRCRPLASQSIDDVMIKSSNTPPKDFMQMLARNDMFERYICELSGKQLHYFCNQIILNVKVFPICIKLKFKRCG